mmetsp:Transcript_13785/g.42696  ORF Transcript_13785/g.42696 Transcript_13785/m.42696 type:complete len:255 (+) Transcript_13785:311-1075(+)
MGEDSRYVRNLALALADRHPTIDRRRLFVYGLSNGGFLALRVACEHADVFAGVWSQAGSGFAAESRCAPAAPIRVVVEHAATDTLIPYFRRVDIPQTGRGDAAAATRIFRNAESAAGANPRRPRGRPAFSGLPALNHDLSSWQSTLQPPQAFRQTSAANTTWSLLTRQRSAGCFATHAQSLLGSSFLKKDVESAQSGSGPGAGLDVGSYAGAGPGVGSYVGAYVFGSHDGCAGHVPHASGQASDASRVSDTKEG